MKRGNVRGHRCRPPAINGPHARVWTIGGCTEGDLWECDDCGRLWVAGINAQWRRVLFPKRALRRAERRSSPT